MIYIAVVFALFSGVLGIIQNHSDAKDLRIREKMGQETEQKPKLLNVPQRVQPYLLIALAVGTAILQFLGIFDWFKPLAVIPIILMAIYIYYRKKQVNMRLEQHHKNNR